MKNKIKTLFLLLFLPIIVFGMSGCTSFMSVEGLLSPPQFEGDQQEIYEALKKSIGGEPDLVYPRTGTYKSAITILNIDDEESNEAIAFYKITATTAGGTVTLPLRVNVLDRRDDKWVSVYDMGVDADEVEKIDLLVADTELYLSVGFNYKAASEKQVKIYRFENNILSLAYDFSAVNYEVFDLDEDDNDEIIKLISVPSYTEDGEAGVPHVEATFVQVMGKSFLEVNQVMMYPGVTEYAAIHVGTLSDGKAAVFLDGLVGTQLVSEILICNASGSLVNLLYDGTEESLPNILQTQRSSGVYTTDVEADGSYEIPQMVAAPGYEEKERYEQLYFTYWHNYNSRGIQRSYLSYADFTLGYVFRMPSSWEGKVTAEISAVDNEITFYEYDANTGERALPILSIRIMSRSGYQNSEISGKYQRLFNSGQFVYLYYAHNNISKLTLSEEIIKDSLYQLK